VHTHELGLSYIDYVNFKHKKSGIFLIFSSPFWSIFRKTKRV